MDGERSRWRVDTYLRVLVGLAPRRLQRLPQSVPRRRHRLPGLGRRRVPQRARVLLPHRRRRLGRRQAPQAEQLGVGDAVAGHSCPQKLPHIHIINLIFSKESSYRSAM